MNKLKQFFSFLKSETNPIQRIKIQVFFTMIALGAIGEVFLILSDLLNGRNAINNIVVTGLLCGLTYLLSKGFFKSATYIYLIGFSLEFFRSYFTSGGIETHALPLFFLLILMAIYLFGPSWHALIYTVLMLTILNLDIPLELSAQFTPLEEDPGAQGKRFVIVNLITIAMSVIFATVFYLVNRFFYELVQHNEHLDELVKERTSQLETEKQRSDTLLLNILPDTIAERLKTETDPPVDNFEEASILFADIVGFTQMSRKKTATELVTILNTIFSECDKLVDHYGLEKIKTIGDAYMVASGVPNHSPNHLVAMADFSLDLRTVIDRLNLEGDNALQIRIGFNSGPVVAGVIGTRKFLYDLWGDSVNIASRMESTSLPGHIQVPETIYHQLKNHYEFTERGETEIKGVGLIKTYFLNRKKSPSPSPQM